MFPASVLSASEQSCGLTAGEGTQHQILRSDKISQITRIFITHMHGDHIFGLIGLLATCGLAGNPESIYMAHPSWMNIRACSRYSQTHFSYPSPHRAACGVYEDEEFTVSCGRLEHRVTTFGYRVVEKDRQGALILKSEGAFDSSGRVYGQLKVGETVTLLDGRQIKQSYVGRWKWVAKLLTVLTVYCEGAVSLPRMQMC